MDADPTPPSWGAEEIAACRAALRPEAGAEFDLVVIGAGITGAGVARDAAARGLRVLVLEAQDVAYGTSSRSSRLIHGGVRYLEQAEFGLVFEALRERDRLYALAPHLVRPARFIFPSFRGDRLGPLRLRLGLTLYDALRLFRGKGHRYLPPRKARTLEPLLGEEGLRGAVWYEDAVTDDARLTLTVLQDALRLGAKALTYAPVSQISAEADGRVRVEIEGGRVHARAVVVAAGPWTGPKLLGQAGRGVLSLSKGIHVVLKASDCPVRAPVVVQTPGQRRILFAVPWGSRTYLGTTDSAYEGDPGQSQVTEAEEDEVLDIVRRVLPHARLGRDAIISTWSGVRPLVRPPGVDADDTVELARTHRIVEGERGVFGIVGGKLTTYRQMAEDVVDVVVAHLKREHGRTDLGPCTTQRRPLVPGRPLSAEELGDPLLADLADRHGPYARTLARMVAENPQSAEPLAPDLPYRWIEVQSAIEHEGCVHLIDILRRRLPLVLTDVALGAHVAPQIAQRLVAARGGSASEVAHELDQYAEAVYGETRRRPPLQRQAG